MLNFGGGRLGSSSWYAPPGGGASRNAKPSVPLSVKKRMKELIVDVPRKDAGGISPFYSLSGGETRQFAPFAPICCQGKPSLPSAHRPVDRQHYLNRAPFSRVFGQSRLQAPTSRSPCLFLVRISFGS